MKADYSSSSFKAGLYWILQCGSRGVNLYIRIIFYILIGAFLISTYFFRDVQTSGDTVRFSESADVLIRSNFNPSIYFKSSIESQLFYYFWLALIGKMKSIAVNDWKAFLVYTNIAAAYLTIIMTIEAILKVVNTRSALIFSSLLFMTSTEYLQWITWVLSDIIYTFLASLVFMLLLTSVHMTKYNSMVKWSGLIMAIISFFFRPSGIPILFFSIVFILITPTLFDKDRVFHKRVAGFILALLIVSGLILSLLWGWLMKDPELLPLKILHPSFTQLSNEYKTGIVVYLKEETYQPPPVTVIDFTTITLLKIFYYLQVISKNHSIFHNASNLLIFSFSGFAGIYSASPWSCWSDKKKHVTWWVLFVMLSYAIFYGTQYVDYDSRYRIPLIPLMILSSSIVFNEIWMFIHNKFGVDTCRSQLSWL
ncbi:MAG: hypothetical protein HQL63_00555 [Magnetococcales bacterium]|nr:hypothetical protein [Magnetococcales bacterium]